MSRLLFGESDQSFSDFIYDPLLGGAARFAAGQRRKVKVHQLMHDREFHIVQHLLNGHSAGPGGFARALRKDRKQNLKQK